MTILLGVGEVLLLLSPRIILALFVPSSRIKKANPKYERKIESIMLSGIIGLDTLIAQAFITSASPNLTLALSLISFAIAIPLLAIGIFLNQALWNAGYEAESIVNYNALKAIGVICSFTGVTAAFWHISWWLGLVFLASAITGVVVATIYLGQLLQEMDQKEETKNGHTTTMSVDDLVN